MMIFLGTLINLLQMLLYLYGISDRVAHRCESWKVTASKGVRTALSLDRSKQESKLVVREFGRFEWHLWIIIVVEAYTLI